MSNSFISERSQNHPFYPLLTELEFLYGDNAYVKYHSRTKLARLTKRTTESLAKAAVIRAPSSANVSLLIEFRMKTYRHPSIKPVTKI